MYIRPLLVSLACILVVGILSVGDAIATDAPPNPSDVSTAQSFCQQEITNGTDASPPTFINPLISCFTDPSQGYIPAVTQSFLTSVEKYFTPMLKAMLIVAVAFFGFKMAMASLERPNSETFILLFKMGGICYFYTHATFYYKYLLAILQNLADLVSHASISLNTAGFCNDSNDNGMASLWGRWDCIFNFIFGFHGAELAVGGIAAYLFEMLTSSGYTGTPTGVPTDFFAGSTVLVAVIGLYAIFALFFACMRFVHLYLMSVLALSFIYCFGFLFVPLILFRGTMQYFQQWLAMIFSFILTPMMLLAFMGMMMVAMDISIFSGDYSVWKMITGSTAGANQDGVASASNDTVDKFKPLFFVALNNQNCTGGANETPNQQGFLGSGHDCNMTEAQMNNDTSNPSRPFSSNIGFDTTGLNLTQLSNNAHAGSIGQYLENVLTSLAVASLLAYIMYTLLQYIPELTQNLVSQGLAPRFPGFTGRGGNPAGQGVIGNALGRTGNAAIASMRPGASASASLAQARAAAGVRR
jgi:type IV secretory pathway VirB6-like protein